MHGWTEIAVIVGLAVNLLAIATAVWRLAVIIQRTVEAYVTALERRRAEDKQDTARKLDHILRNQHRLYDEVANGGHNARDDPDRADDDQPPSSSSHRGTGR